MATDQELRRQIETVSDLSGIVRTMKALAAVNGRQFERALQSLGEYEHTVEMGLQVALRGKPLRKAGRQRPPAGLAAVIFGSDVGLCGRFNEDLVALAVDTMNGWQVPLMARRVLAVGARVEARLNEHGHPLAATLPTPGSPLGIAPTLGQILQRLDAWREQSIEHVWLFYSHAGVPRMVHLLPVDLQQFSRLIREPWPSRTLPGSPLDPERLLAACLRQHVFVSLFRACLASLAAEQQLRLQAMQAAEKNIQERLEGLVSASRCQRQNAIDAELLDIGAGFEAVTGGLRRGPAR